jgi:hypothetical protein
MSAMTNTEAWLIAGLFVFAYLEPVILSEGWRIRANRSRRTCG